MKFYEIKADRIIRLDTIRTVQVLDKEIYITFTCGDTRSERVVFASPAEAADAFDDLCDTLGVEVKE